MGTIYKHFRYIIRFRYVMLKNILFLLFLKEMHFLILPYMF